MNIIYMHSHDTGRYISPYGHKVETPNLMRLAKGGVVFRNAYSAAPTCSPSRTALASGMSPHSVGMNGLVNRGFKWANTDYSKHLSHFLSQQGYETVLCGIEHEAPDATLLGYQINCNPSNPFKNNVQRDTFVATRAAEYIHQEHDKPFYMSIGFFNTHRKFPPIAEDIDPNYVLPPFPLADTKENREDTAGYLTSARIMDRCVGIVLEALEASGKVDDTLIIFTTDHGVDFPKMKCNLMDTGIGVSLIMKLPEQNSRGEVIDSLVSHIDIFPTICDFIGAEKPEWLEGKSLKPLLDGETDQVNDQVFAEVSYHAGYEPMRCVRTERYKLIRFFGDYNKTVLANIGDSLSKQFLLDHGFQEERREPELLFDLYLDPVERQNRLQDPRYKEVYEDLSGRLDQWMKQTNDPLLQGEVSKGEGKVNTLNCISPMEKDYLE